MGSHRSFILITALTTLCFVIPVKAYAASSAVVTATVSIARCGNGVVELDESCDESIKSNISCKDYGFDEGSLFCNKKCKIDFSGCLLANTKTVGKIEETNKTFPKPVFIFFGLVGVLMISRGFSILVKGKNPKLEGLSVKPAYSK